MERTQIFELMSEPRLYGMSLLTCPSTNFDGFRSDAICYCFH
jgi:hypothetical protein